MKYDTLGYVIVPEVFPAEEIAAIEDEIVRLTAECDPSQTFLLLGLRSELTRQVCADDRILTRIEDIVYPGIAIYSAKMVPKLPGAEHHRCHWHQDDASYSGKSQSERRMSVWLALNDSDADNGGVWFLPGSHRWGL